PAGDGVAGGLPFSCHAGLCLARHASGVVIAHAAGAEAAGPACAAARVIVIDDATAENPCPGSEALVVTKRDLARRGSAAIRFDAEGRPRIEYAIAEEPRVWHRQRRFSREARGLPPWRRPEPGAGAD